METEHIPVPEMPIGYRFVPTDEELVRFYLMKKVQSLPVPADCFLDIDASDLYSKSPTKLAEQFPNNERKWYLFVRQLRQMSKNRQHRMVGDGVGFWKIMGEDPIHNIDGKVFAYKKRLTYFAETTKPLEPKRTKWRMEEYILRADHSNIDNDMQAEEWVLAKIKKGRDYTYC